MSQSLELNFNVKMDSHSLRAERSLSLGTGRFFWSSSGGVVGFKRCPQTASRLGCRLLVRSSFPSSSKLSQLSRGAHSNERYEAGFQFLVVRYGVVSIPCGSSRDGSSWVSLLVALSVSLGDSASWRYCFLSERVMDSFFWVLYKGTGCGVMSTGTWPPELGACVVMSGQKLVTSRTRPNHTQHNDLHSAVVVGVWSVSLVTHLTGDAHVPHATRHAPLCRLVRIPLSLVSCLSRLLSLVCRVSLVSCLSCFVSVLLLSSVLSCFCLSSVCPTVCV